MPSRGIVGIAEIVAIGETAGRVETCGRCETMSSIDQGNPPRIYDAMVAGL